MFTAEERRLGKELKHDCELAPEEDILVKYINSGMFVFARRKIRHQFLLSEGNYDCKHYLRSSYVMKREIVRHLKWHYYMIHPYSKFAMYVKLIMMLSFLFMFIILPIQMILENKKLQVMEMIVDVIYVIYVILVFNMGYLDKKFNRVILNRRDVCKNYIFSWFIVDLVSALNIIGECMCYLDLFYCPYTYPFYLVSYIKVLRVYTLFKYMEEFRKYTQITRFQCKIVKLFLTVIYAFLWCSGLFYIATNVGNPNKYHDAVHMMECLKNVAYLIFLFGSREPYKTDAQLLVEIFCFFMGAILRIVLLLHLLQIVTKFSSSSSAFYKLIQQVEEFMRYRNLPNALRSRISTYCDFRFQLNHYKESDVLRVLSPSLRKEVLVHTHMHLLEKVVVFEDLPISVLYTIIYNMKPEIFMPSDVIVIAGTVGDCMYFIASGTVAVYTPSGKEICHLSDGSNFGEIALLMENEHRVATVVAIDCCELFVLNRKDFTEQLNKFPEVFNRMRKSAQDKVRQTLIASMRGDGIIGDMTTDLVTELQTKKNTGKTLF